MNRKNTVTFTGLNVLIVMDSVNSVDQSYLCKRVYEELNLNLPTGDDGPTVVVNTQTTNVPLKKLAGLMVEKAPHFIIYFEVRLGSAERYFLNFKELECGENSARHIGIRLENIRKGQPLQFVCYRSLTRALKAQAPFFYDLISSPEPHCLEAVA
jgi:hypothetical protein